MRIVTNDDARRWCAENGFALNPDTGGMPCWRDSRISNGVSFLTESKQSQVQALVRYLVRGTEFGGAVVWITDFPFAKPDELAVVTRFRATVGETRWLVDAPAHVFDFPEADDCVGLFNLCVQYVWDAFLYLPKSGLVAYNSHDDIQYLSYLNEPGRGQLKSIVGNYNLDALPSLQP